MVHNNFRKIQVSFQKLRDEHSDQKEDVNFIQTK